MSNSQSRLQTFQLEVVRIMPSGAIVAQETTKQCGSCQILVSGAYPHDTVGSYDEFREKVRQSEEPSFHDKLPQLVWRGHTKLDDHAHLAAVRNSLLEASKGHDWNNVDGFNDDRADGNRIDMQ